MAIKYAVITENDESNWDDETGKHYHFPKKYRGYIPEGTKVIYYKGKIKNQGFANQRLSKNPHYFGTAEIDYLKADPKSKKGDYFAILKNYVGFDEPISNINQSHDTYYEIIPPNLISNYWMNAVRPITEEIYNAILNNANYKGPIEDAKKEFETIYIDGQKKIRYGSYYERNRCLRNRAVEIHGLSCMVCNLNFEDTYGKLGKEYIHVHHTRPLAETGKCIINPQTDLVVVCPNCHSMIHRPKDKVLTVNELRDIIQANKRA